MNFKIELERRLKRKRTERDACKDEISQLETQLAEKGSKLQGIDDVIKELDGLLGMLEKESDPVSPSSVEIVIRRGSDGWKAREILQKVGRPLYVDDLLERMEKEVTKNNRASLAGQLGWYVRKGKIFTRPNPNTFGLAEWGHVNGPMGEFWEESLSQESETPEDAIEID